MSDVLSEGCLLTAVTEYGYAIAVIDAFLSHASSRSDCPYNTVNLLNLRSLVISE